MDAELTSPTRSPYLLENPPTSSGRVLLSRAFEHYCLLQWGIAGEEIAAALIDGGDSGTRGCVGMAAQLLGGVLARGLVCAWARPLGGGEPIKLRATTWELDDFRSRFASSALDPARPFDPGAVPTHWIFVDLDGWNEVLEASVGRPAPPVPAKAAEHAPVRAEQDHRRGGSDVDAEERLVRLPEVERRTGLSRSTIYRKMGVHRFPSSVPLSDNAVGWRESEVAEWIGNPR